MSWLSTQIEMWAETETRVIFSSVSTVSPVLHLNIAAQPSWPSHTDIHFNTGFSLIVKQKDVEKDLKIYLPQKEMHLQQHANLLHCHSHLSRRLPFERFILKKICPLETTNQK